VDEFSLIRQYFDVRPLPGHVARGIGDDAAILDCPADCQLLVSTDTLVSGVHFFPDADPASLGHKALAVNLSDIAAMGGRPAWFTLALTLPEPDVSWLKAFSASLHKLAESSGVSLVGGDTTSGPLSITITMIGTAARQKAICRDNAAVGDAILVTGALGDAAMALRCRSNDIALDDANTAFLNKRLDCPMPRLEEGALLARYASAMIDVSDGLSSDLGHIIAASQVGAELYAEKLPVSEAMQQAARRAGIDDAEVLSMVLNGGDDYELCATVPQTQLPGLLSAWSTALAPVIPIGTITAQEGLSLHGDDGTVQALNSGGGYKHFNE
jgi:thiamine-monophosphate kinase